MINYSILNDIRTEYGSRMDSGNPKAVKTKFDSIMEIISKKENVLNQYNNFVWGVASSKWGSELTNGKRFDASYVLGTYETLLYTDQRITQQILETSWLRKNFENFPGEKIFKEFTGIPPAAKNYNRLMAYGTGYNGTVTNQSARIKPSTDPNEIKTIQAALSNNLRDVVTYEEQFKISYLSLEQASYQNFDVNGFLSNRLGRDLAMQEQYTAFNYNPNTANAPTYTYGLLGNSSISSAIVWTAGNITTNATTSVAIVNEFVGIWAQIEAATKGAFSEAGHKKCCLMSLNNFNALTRPYSDLVVTPVLQSLTDRGYRIGVSTMLTDNQIFFYYDSPDVVELSTSVMVEALPQEYRDASWIFRYRNVTAGLTVTQPEGIYLVTGMGD